MLSDQEIIANVNHWSRSYVNINIPWGEKLLPYGHRCDMDRTGFVRRFWERAAKEYKEATGLDVREALSRHEAWLRSPENAPQLYIERR